MRLITALVLVATALSSGCESDTDSDVNPENSANAGAALSNSPLAYLSFESSTWEPPTSNSLWLKDPWHNEKKYKLRFEGGAENVKGWISGTMANEGSRSLGIRLEGMLGCDAKQRLELELASELPDHTFDTVHLEQERYWGFALFIHPQSGPLKTNVVFNQAWQIHNTANEWGRFPPLALAFVKGTDYEWVVNTSTDAADGAAPGVASEIQPADGPLTKGVWHEFIIRFKPSIRKNGIVTVWRNGIQRLSQTHERNFGYAVRAGGASDVDVPWIDDAFRVRFGAYRGRYCERNSDHSHPSNMTNDFILMFDQVKFGLNKDSVDP